MKKCLLLIAAVCAAFTINAKEIVVDLSQYVKAGDNAEDVIPTLTNGELTVRYSFAGEWGNGGVAFELDNLDVTNLAFEYIGDTVAKSWVSFIVYLEDSEGGLWYSSEADLSISSWVSEWTPESYMPTDVLWESSEASAPVKPFVTLGFLANPAAATTASFAIRNVKLTVPDDQTSLDNTSAEQKTNKVIRDGQIMILRDGKTFNALGTEIK